MRVTKQDFSTARSFFMSTEATETTDETFVPIEWLPEGRVRFLDQTLLPHEEVWVETGDYRVIAEAIRRLQVRGAPLIGIAAAYGLALAAHAGEPLDVAAAGLRSTRPTAVNLSWALDRCLRAIKGLTDQAQITERLTKGATAIHQEDIKANRGIGAYGAELLRDQSTVLTHCNAGSLATGGYGTALGVIRSAATDGRIRRVIATETRPLLQGARLTAWELARDGISFALIVDSAVGSVLQRGLVDAVIVGADRIAANGDVANKIGTYQLAVLAHESRVPFYVAAPTSTIDLSLDSGAGIPIEERAPDEVTPLNGAAMAGATALNPAFDVTPNTYVTAIITENGVASAPYIESLRRVCTSEVPVRG
jgi:methylthioribose-1-phosphate isomerase